METLAQIYERHRTEGDVGHGDKGSIHSYIPVYESLLREYRQGCTFMEIGLAKGLSLAMWREYTPTSTIVGVDKCITFDRTPHESTGTIVVECDATIPALLDHLGDLQFDVIIDDGSHALTDQIASFQILKPRMKPGGLYIVEDLLNPHVQFAAFRQLHDRVGLIDLRKNKGYFADALAVFKF